MTEDDMTMLEDADGAEFDRMFLEMMVEHHEGAIDMARTELADGEETEARIIEAYLPAELPDGELREIVAAAIAETGATSPKDMGKVMKAAMAQVDGRADGRRVSALVREALAR